MIPLDIIMEAKKGNTPKKSQKIEAKSNDYTQEIEDEPEDETPDEPTQVDAGEDSTDYTAEIEDTDEVEAQEDQGVAEPGGDNTDPNETTDYTEDIESGDGEGVDGGEGVEGEDPAEGGDETTDYTDGMDNPEDGGEGGEMPEDGTDPGAEPESDENEKRNKSLLHQDFIDLYYAVKAIIQKLNAVDKSNIMVNKVIIIVNQNLVELKKYLYSYIVYEFSKNRYVDTIYKYNYFLEALNINVAILRKTKVFIVNGETIK